MEYSIWNIPYGIFHMEYSIWNTPYGIFHGRKTGRDVSADMGMLFSSAPTVEHATVKVRMRSGVDKVE